jgi:hypothetical protein
VLSAMNVAPLAVFAVVASLSHAAHRPADHVWSHVRCGSAVYERPHNVRMGLGNVSTTACHVGSERPRCRREAQKRCGDISGTARYLMTWTPPAPKSDEIVTAIDTRVVAPSWP